MEDHYPRLGLRTAKSGGIKKGGLHRTLGIPEDQKISNADKVKASESSDPKERKQG